MKSVEAHTVLPNYARLGGKQRLIVQNNAKKNHELDEAGNIQLRPEGGLPILFNCPHRG